MPSDLFHEHKPEHPKGDLKDEISGAQEDWLDRIVRRRSAMYDASWAQLMSFRYGKAGNNGASVKVEGEPSSSQEYDIDPITNRKVPIQVTEKAAVQVSENLRKSIEVPVKTFKGYRSQFSDLQPPSTNMAEPIRPKPTSQQGLEEEFTAAGEQPKKTHPTLVNRIQIAKDPEKKLPSTSKAPSHKVSAKPDSTGEGLKSFDSKMSYDKPFGSTELDQKAGIEEGLKSFDLKMSYNKPYLAHEPDGKYADSEGSKPATSGLDAFDPEAHHNKLLVAHEPDRKYANREGPNLVNEGLKEFDSKMSYARPFLAHEPDGRYAKREEPDLVQNGLKEFDAKMAYDKPFLAHEPDGKYADREERARVEDGLRTPDPKMACKIPYTTYKSDAQLTVEGKPDSVRDCLKDYEERYPYPESQARLRIDGSKQKDANLDASKPLYYDEPFGKRRTPPNCISEDTTRSPLKSWAGMTEAEKLSSRKALDAAFDEVPEDSRPKYPKIELRYSNIRTGDPTTRKMTGNFLRDFPEEFKTKWTTGKTSSGTLMRETTKPNAGSVETSSRAFENNVQRAENEYIEGLASKESFSRRRDTKRIQTSLDRGTSGLSTKPEQESKSSESNCTKDSAHQGESDPSESVSTFGSGRHGKSSVKEHLDSNGKSTVPLSLGQESSRRLDELRSIYDAKYGAITKDHRQSPKEEQGESSSEGPKPSPKIMQPIKYKILAYDPTMQSVSIAETTSVVPDASSPLAPAEVLLRLSNPTKFFPHFEDMKMQGYEIVSGSGDVLVFRKVRPATEPTPLPEQKRRNPIDGMQGSPIVATGNFASPTGFVNLDLPTSVREEPRFKSNIDVRREEPVFSGKRNWYDETEERRRKTPSLGRRLLTGAVWVGALCYASGVVIEFFTTGGADGLGAQGF